MIQIKLTRSDVDHRWSASLLDQQNVFWSSSETFDSSKIAYYRAIGAYVLRKCGGDAGSPKDCVRSEARSQIGPSHIAMHGLGTGDQCRMNIIGGVLSKEDIVLGLTATDAKRACEEIALHAARRHQVDAELVFRALWRREKSGSTALGHGIAIPHARLPGITHPLVLFVRTKVSIPFGAPDRRPVSAFFVILVPEHANEEHLRILATVSEMLSDEGFRDRLEAATDPIAIQRLFGQCA
jgi:PTS system nitrogen regulatory IIA component